MKIPTRKMLLVLVWLSLLTLIGKCQQQSERDDEGTHDQPSELSRGSSGSSLNPHQRSPNPEFVSDALRQGHWKHWWCRWRGSSSPGCNGRPADVTAPYGFLQSPGYGHECPYPANTRCDWRLVAAFGKVIYIKFIHLNVTDESPSCLRDYIMAYDGEDTSSKVIGKYCGDGALPEFSSTGRYLYLNFRSDDVIGGTGFSFVYWQATLEQAPDTCPKGVVPLVDDNGIFSSPGYERKEYPINTRCQWRITAPPGMIIQLHVKDFNMEDTSDCENDQLLIHDGRSQAARVVRTLCGRGSDVTLYSNSPFMFITFWSDSSVTGDGFEASYKFVEMTTTIAPTPEVTTPPVTTCPPTPIVLMGESGSFSTPYYDDNRNFPARSICRWTIQAAEGKLVSLRIPLLELTPGTDILVVEEPTTFNPRMLGQYSGTYRDLRFLSSGNTLTVVMFSKSPDGARGFRASYEQINVTAPDKCPDGIVHYNTSTGYIASPNYGPRKKYPSDSKCSWLISVPQGKVIEIFFRDIHTEESFDYVYVHDGPTSGHSEFLVFSGDYELRQGTGSFNQMLVRFTSDGSANSDGFLATYRTVDPREGACIHGGVVDLDGPRGSLSSPGLYAGREYPGFSNCSWRITTSDNMILNLTFTLFGLSVFDCPSDKLVVHDGADTSAPILAAFCSQQPDHAVISTGSTILVRFVTDGRKEAVGFQAHYTSLQAVPGATCPRDVVVRRDSRGMLTPPYPPGNLYTNSATCRWRIEAKNNEVIQFRILFFKLESCWTDTLDFYDGIDDTAPHLESFCGTYIPRGPISSGPAMYVIFRSDRVVRGRGFVAEYRTLSLSQVPKASPSHCPDSPVLLRSQRGEIKSPYYGPVTAYPNNVTCQWNITVPAGKLVRLNFTFFELEYHRLCQFDSLRIDDGERPIVLCGSRKPPPAPYTSRSNTILLTFKSDSKISFPGFRLSYRAVDPGTISPVPQPMSPAQPPCGVSTNPRRRGLYNILGGNPAVANSWPWHVALFIKGEYKCGGTLITSQWIVTAAHCVYDSLYARYLEPYQLKIGVGNHNITQTGVRGGRIVNVKEIIVHPDRLVRHRRRHDIALVKLNESLAYNDTVRPACAPRHPPKEGVECYTSGWGSEVKDGFQKFELHEVELDIVNRSACKHGENGHPMRLLSGMVCAGRTPAKKGPCEGDSGGPLMCEENGQFSLYGVTTWGHCNQKDKPHVFTDVYHYMDFIGNHVKT